MFMAGQISETLNKHVSKPAGVGQASRLKKLSSCSTQLNTRLIILISIKMPTFVEILTFISMINTTSESLKAKQVLIVQHFSFL